MTSINSIFLRIPFIRISGLFIIGILVNNYLLTDDRWVGLLFLFLLSMLIYWWNNNHFSLLQIQNILLSFVIFLCGLFYPTKTSEKHVHSLNKDDLFIAEICHRPVEKKNSYQTFLLIRNNRIPHAEKVIAWFDKKHFDTTLMAGDQLFIYTKLQEIKGKNNPYDFDYRSMMHNLGIDYSVYVSRYKKSGIQSNKLIYIGERMRDKLISLLNQSNIQKNELAVISALTLGYRSELDKETRDYFTDTGTIHVLSVSGLHVAMIFYILSLLFSPINQGKSAKYIYPAFMIMLLWGYAFITGFSPPVQRATLVFSFVIIGKILKRPVNIFNSLFASALILILYNPHVLFDIGFQLSYLAIFGIVLLQPPFDKILQVKNKTLKWGWTLFTASIAAQIVTFPLSIFYFKQFPNLFWLSNFIAIPGTTLILWLTMLFFVVSPISILSNSHAALLQLVTHQLLLVLKWMSNLPHAVSDGIIYDHFQTIVIYGILTTLIIYCFSKHKRWLYSSLVLLICFQTANLHSNFKLYNQKIIHVYHSNSLVHCINGRNSYIIHHENTQPYTSYDIEMIQNVCDQLKLNQPKFIKIKESEVIAFNDLVIKNGNISFLNCNINLTDQFNFTIKGDNFERFKWANQELINKITGQMKIYQTSSTPSNKDTFSINFSMPKRQWLCINMK